MQSACRIGGRTPQQEALIERKALDSLVATVNQSGLEVIYAYTGDERHHPIFYEEIGLFKQMALRAGLRCRIQDISDDCFSPEEWDPRSSLLLIPGAQSRDLDKHLESKIPAIRTYIEKGGGGIFWCGGGYWACRHVKYRIDETTLIDKVRELCMWKGEEHGPLLFLPGPPEETISFFHGAVTVKWPGSEHLQRHFPEGIQLKALLSGGGFLIPAEDEHPYKPLALYAEEEKGRALAGVKTRVGKGLATIMNPYFTYHADYLRRELKIYEKFFPRHKWRQIVQDLEGNELKCAICFVDIILEVSLRRSFE